MRVRASVLRILAIALMIASVVAAAGCGGGLPSPTRPPPCSQDCGLSPSPEISVSPVSDTLGLRGARQFQATLKNVTGSVTWKVEEGSAGGTITSTGLYIAPNGTGTFHVTAITTADGSQSTAKVTVVPSGFTPTGDIRAARTGYSATLLADGRVLIGGGGDRSGVFASAELFDPAAGSFAPTAGNMIQAREGHSAVLLPSGKVLIAGGDDFAESLTSAELFDPANKSFTATGNMTTARGGATATLLPDGKVLVAGGVDKSDAPLATAKLYDPTAGTFAAIAGNMASARWSHTATLLANGKVLLAGGRSSFTLNVHAASAELIDPFTTTFTTTGSMTTGRDFHTATLLPHGRVLLLGGNQFFSVSSAELYDPVSGNFTVTGHLSTPRHFHTATLLPGGKVLVAGGVNEFPGQESPEFQRLWSAELFDPASGNSSFTGSLETERVGHTATLPHQGQVLVVGGAALPTTEMYK